MGALMTSRWPAPAEAGKFSLIAMLIPVWQPEMGFVRFVESLIASGFDLILIVDDGSGPASQSIFSAVQQSGVRIVRHAVNLGKGRALKTGFNCLLTDFPELRGIVTADADGQHTLPDILRVADTLLKSDGQPVMGARRFGGQVPMRSKVGNLLTRYIFNYVTGVKLRDTQSGLRGLPVSLLPELIALEGEHYEYEMTMLAHLCREGAQLIEVPIETVYIDSNRSSHFNPVRDSMRIYFVLARFYASSILAAGVDFAGFSLAFAATHNILVSVGVGRLSSLVNFALNQRFVFHNRGSVVSALWRYYVLVLVMGSASYGLIWTLTAWLHWNVFAAKFCVDIALSVVSFSVQRAFIFRRPQTV
jgi:glycosyltransferase involved in cell wall biosynthesis